MLQNKQKKHMALMLHKQGGYSLNFLNLNLNSVLLPKSSIKLSLLRSRLNQYLIDCHPSESIFNRL